MINFVIGYFVFFAITVLGYICLNWIVLLVLAIIFGLVFIDELLLFIKRKRDTMKNKRLIKEAWKSQSR